VIAAFRALRRALDDTESEDERALLRNAVRDALDRDAATLGTERRIVANSWTVTGEIHRGPHFVIEALRHRDLGDRWAIKRILPAHARDPLFRDMLLREAANHLRVQHPAVLRAHALLRLEDGSPALVLEYRQGPSLAGHLRDSALTPPQILQVASRICEALSEVHSRGITHGDVTPANILLPQSEPGLALLCDFGLSTASGEGIDGFEALGTPGFVAPEAAIPHGLRHPGTDIYGLGAVVGACLDAACACDCVALRQLAASLCMENAASRPPTVAAVQHRLRTIASEL